MPAKSLALRSNVVIARFTLDARDVSDAHRKTIVFVVHVHVHVSTHQQINGRSPNATPSPGALRFEADGSAGFRYPCTAEVPILTPLRLAHKVGPFLIGPPRRVSPATFFGLQRLITNGGVAVTPSRARGHVKKLQLPPGPSLFHLVLPCSPYDKPASPNPPKDAKGSLNRCAPAALLVFGIRVPASRWCLSSVKLGTPYDPAILGRTSRSPAETTPAKFSCTKTPAKFPQATPAKSRALLERLTVTLERKD
ncbi:hypothetical protein BU15DRAFT_79258 [Melanogaster broomeanus]|nr:hypothetical protein BU15DRAFT_79258 [Melanogaster broomeanus]